jgi:DNA polymerase III epsilon subunit-like protein
MSRYNLRSSKMNMVAEQPMVTESVQQPDIVDKEMVSNDTLQLDNPIQPKPTNLILVFDTETTGLIPYEDYSRFTDSDSRLEYMKEVYPNIIQLSYLLYDTCNKTIIEKGNYYIKIDPSIIIQEQSIAIHGITREKIEEMGVSIDFALMKFYNAYVRANCIVGHNLEFDKKMIQIEIERNYHEAYTSLMRSDASPPKSDVRRTVDMGSNIDVVSQGGSIIVQSNMENIRCDNTDLKRLSCMLKIESSYCTMKHSIDVCNLVLESHRMGKLGPHEFTVEVLIHGMMYSKRMYKKYPTLAELYHKLFGSVPTGLHDSMVDVETCLQCYLKMNHPTTPPPSHNT